MTQLMLAQIGPVQSFIAQARRTQDLHVGSLMLSDLAASGIHTASQLNGFEPIFPYFTDRIPDSVPHRFAFLMDGNTSDAAAMIEAAIRERWFGQFAKPVFKLLEEALGDGDWRAVYERQAEAWLQFQWVAVDYDTRNHQAAFAHANRAMAQRKQFRQFPALDEPGTKCTLTGSQSALFSYSTYQQQWDRVRGYIHDHDSIVIRKGENLGTLATIKRLARRAGCLDAYQHITFRDTDTIAADNEAVGEGKSAGGYLAILHMDGDRMGQYLASLTRLEDHQQFSASLSEYASQHVPQIIREYGGNTGTLVYAGGDDVLAMLPVKHAIPCAIRLRDVFEQLTGRTASAGISMTPSSTPLDMALETAREAEHSAKESYGRDAIVITEAHGTGQIRSAGITWDVITHIQQFQHLFAERIVSGKFGYELLDIASEMGGIVPPEARLAEIKRVLRRRIDPTMRGEHEATIFGTIEALADTGEQSYSSGELGWAEIARLLIMMRFIAQSKAKEVVS